MLGSRWTLIDPRSYQKNSSAEEESGVYFFLIYVMNLFHFIITVAKLLGIK